MHVKTLFQGQDATIRGKDQVVSGLACDSRLVKQNFLFAALLGSQTNGLQFVNDAIKNGASCILSEEYLDINDVTCVQVKDARAALSHAAAKFYGNPSEAMQCIGVTGTNGKTTTVHIIESIVNATNKKTGIMGTLGIRVNDHVVPTELTTPESIEIMSCLAHLREQRVSTCIMEVSSHALALKRTDGMLFDVAVWTNLSHDHLDFHGTHEIYFNAKSRLFHSLLKPNGVRVINIDDSFGSRLIKEEQTITYSHRSQKHTQVGLMLIL